MRMENNRRRQKELETDDRERSERKVRKEKKKKKTMVTMANLTPDDRDAKRKTDKHFCEDDKAR